MRLPSPRLASLLLPLCLVLGACGTMEATENTSGTLHTRVFDLTPQRADTAIRQAIEEQYHTIHRDLLGSGRIGYRIIVQSVQDLDVITAEAIRDPAGGYIFEIGNRGTTAALGVPARNTLTRLIEKHAARLEQP